MTWLIEAALMTAMLHFYGERLSFVGSYQAVLATHKLSPNPFCGWIFPLKEHAL